MLFLYTAACIIAFLCLWEQLLYQSLGNAYPWRPEATSTTRLRELPWCPCWVV